MPKPTASTRVTCFKIFDEKLVQSQRASYALSAFYSEMAQPSSHSSHPPPSARHRGAAALVYSLATNRLRSRVCARPPHHLTENSSAIETRSCPAGVPLGRIALLQPAIDPFNRLITHSENTTKPRPLADGKVKTGPTPQMSLLGSTPALMAGPGADCQGCDRGLPRFATTSNRTRDVSNWHPIGCEPGRLAWLLIMPHCADCCRSFERRPNLHSERLRSE
jgi:hypothetical protein